MKAKIFIRSLVLVLSISFSQYYFQLHFSGSAYAQTDGTSQKNIKKEKKKRMKDAYNADRGALKRHQDIQTKATRKRMKKHLKQTKKNVQNQHR